MKKSLPFILLILMGCSTELDIIDKNHCKPVVYSLMNPFDSVQLVRVHKMFTIQTQSDWQTINIDSIVYHDVVVKISGKKGEVIKWTDTLQQTKINLDSGFFPSKDFKEYVLNHPLPIHLVDNSPGDYGLGQPDVDSLVLEVQVNDLDLSTRASAPVLEPFLLAMAPSGKSISLYGDKPSRIVLFGGDCDPKKDFCYRQIKFWVHYKDYHQATEGIVREVSWMTSNGWDPYDYWYYLSAERLFNRMKLLIPEDDHVVARTLDSIDVQIISPSWVFSQWWEIKDYQEQTNDPPYTNFDHSYGLFATYKIGERTGLKLNQQALDTLCNGYLYKCMKFKSW